MKTRTGNTEADEPFEKKDIGSSSWFRIQDFQSCDTGSYPVPMT